MTKMNWERVRVEAIDARWRRGPRPAPRDALPDRDWFRESDWSVLRQMGRAQVDTWQRGVARTLSDQATGIRKAEPTVEQLESTGESLVRDGRFRRARTIYETARRRHPKRADLHWGYAYSSYRLGHYEEAVRACHAALRCDPSHDRAQRTLGFALMDLENWQGAIDAFRALATNRPQDKAVRLSLARAYRNARQFELAADVLSSALVLDPECATAHCERGMCLLELGNVNAADSHLEHLEDLNESAADRLRKAILAFRDSAQT